MTALTVPFVCSPTEDTVPSYVLYSPQGSRPLAGLHVEGGTVSRYYDKETRSQLIRTSPSAHISFLRNTKSRVGRISSISSSSSLSTNGGGSLASSQRVVILQIFCEESACTAFSLTVELTLQDKLGRHRILFSNTFQKLQRCAQHVKVPLRCVAPGVWSNIVLDVHQIHATLYANSGGRLSTAELIKSRRLLSVTLGCSSVCRIRRILGMPQLPPSYRDLATAEWPLSLRLPPEVHAYFWVIRTCEEEFLQQRIADGPCHHLEAFSHVNSTLDLSISAPVHKKTLQKPVPAVPFQSFSVSSVVESGVLRAVPGASDRGGGVDPHVALMSVAAGENGLSASCTKGCQADGSEPKWQSGTIELSALAGSPPRSVPRCDASVQTSLPAAVVTAKKGGATEQLQLVGTRFFDTRTPVTERPVKVVNLIDMTHVVFDDEEEQREEEVEDGEWWPRSKNNGNEVNKKETVSVPVAFVAPTPSRYFDSPGRPDKKEMTNMRGAQPRETVLNIIDKNVPEVIHAPSLNNYANTLNLMRQRVKCIQALISESREHDVSLNEGEISPDDDRCATGGGNNNNEHNHKHGGCEDNDHQGERPWPQLSAEGQHVILCDGSTQKQQQGPFSSRCFMVPQEHRPEKIRGVPVQNTLIPCSTMRTTDEGVAHVCTYIPNDGEKDMVGTDEEDEEDEGFTVNVCTSGDHERPAVVVPGESSALSKKPPVSSLRPEPREVDRLCFDSSFSENGFIEPLSQRPVHRTTQLVEDDSMVLSGPLSPDYSGPITSPAPAAAPSVTQAQRTRATHHRGRLGEQARGEIVKLEAFQALASTATNTPPPSPRHGNGGEEVESSISTAEYRRPSMSRDGIAAGGFSATAANAGRFISVGSNCEVDGEKDKEEDDARQPFCLPSLPPKSPSQKQQQQYQHPGPLASREDSSTLLSSPLVPLTRSCQNAHLGDTKKECTVKSANNYMSNIRSMPLSSTHLNKPPKGADDAREKTENAGDSLVFDPLLQCCLDLRSNTYVVTIRSPEGAQHK
ncbi:hypothetical protein C3747_24g363 [Trypanosoma cruzi]|uniref:CFA20 domain-containing protein n=2 Tax=Trypanosoma cruzi TaxID=5693 RepID=Q4CZE4_TRYCC|nr:hypothetical protein, conserved [Trypanosoma cruzi]EAN85650.1 hypothetical protein, conserved [Trypanosoma cruzi]PWV16225.1 hypothetical protein C3747_24g363 [Trypanosoma cruzi]RNC55444.1 hypothetical protein TcCL_ESM07082 [Trypanosoma cruzi]|eukprot:XP_807501.1 hypothetical protein [Trypanosoma cruzi strain CL Brener]